MELKFSNEETGVCARLSFGSKCDSLIMTFSPRANHWTLQISSDIESDNIIKFFEQAEDLQPISAKLAPGIEIQMFRANTHQGILPIYLLTLNGMKYLFAGELDGEQWEKLLSNDSVFQRVISGIDVLIAHHGDSEGVYVDLFKKWGCQPTVVMATNVSLNYDAKLVSAYYREKVKGLYGFRGTFGQKTVLNVQAEGPITFIMHGDSRSCSAI